MLCAIRDDQQRREDRRRRDLRETDALRPHADARVARAADGLRLGGRPSDGHEHGRSRDGDRDPRLQSESATIKMTMSRMMMTVVVEMTIVDAPPARSF